MASRGRMAGLALTGALLAGVLLAYQAGQPGGASWPSQGADPENLTLQASPRTVDEGDFVQLLASAENPDGGALDYTWDLGDGSEPRSGSDLTSISYRYLQDRAGYTVRVTVANSQGGSAEKTLRVHVLNAPPEIQVIERDGPALVGEPLGLRATATDPGPLDKLTFSWDFGDGQTGEGSSVSHVFREAGRYTVAVTVTDGDGGEDTATLDVVVGLGHQFTIQGDVDGFREGQVSIQGQPLSSGRCYVLFWFLSEDGQPVHFPGFALHSVLRGGFRVGDYAIGAMPNEWFELDVAMGAPDLFFGGLQIEPDERTLPSGVVEDEILAGFRSHGGVLSVNYVDERYVEGTFQVRLEETGQLFYGYQRHANVVGHFAARLASGEDGDMPAVYVGVPGYRCRPTETFDIADRTPEPNQSNVDWQNPELAIDFTEALDVSSIAANVRVDYRLPDLVEGASPQPQYRTLDGGWAVDPADDHRIRFTPQAPLIDGVIYCVRVRSGESGIRGAEGQVLEYASPGFGARTSRACADGNPWDEAVEWAFSTIPELSNVRARVYQVHRNVKLVPEKSTLTRVLWDWRPKEGIHPEAQVDSIPADVRVEVGGKLVYPPKVRRALLRSDRFDWRDTIHADNGIKFFGWRPPSGPPVSPRVTVEPSDQRASPPRHFEGTTPHPIERWDRSPSLTFDYYFVRIGEWADSVPRLQKKDSHLSLIKHGAPFVTENFPVTGTHHRYRGEVAVDPPLLDNQWRGWADGSADFSGWALKVRLSTAVAWELWNFATPTDADVIVGIVPDGTTGPQTSGRLEYFTETGWDYSRVLGGKRVILLQAGTTFAETVLAHEFGHLIGLCHTNDPLSPDRIHDCVTGPWSWEGFRILDRRPVGWNKDEGNPQAPDGKTVVPLMFSRAHGVPPVRPLDKGTRFITREHYLRAMRNMDRQLFSMAEPPAPPIRLASLVPIAMQTEPADPAPVAVVEGVLDTGSGVAAIRSVRSGLRSSSTPPEPGPFTVRSYDGGGRELDAISFTGEQSFASDVPPDTAASGVRFFNIEIPEAEQLARVTVEHQGAILAEMERSDNPPMVAFVKPRSGMTVTGQIQVRWQSGDADGDPVVHRLRYSPDGESWQVLAWATPQTAYALDTDDLIPGPAPRLELMASDGFNETVASLELWLMRELRVVSLSPAEGQTLGDDETVEVTFLEQLDAKTVSSLALSLRGPDGTEVFADVIHTPGSNRLAIVPVEPLAAGTYAATLHAGIADRLGNRLDEDMTWSFESAGTLAHAPLDEAPAVEAADELEAADDSVDPIDAPGDPARPSEAAGDALGRDGVRWASIRAAGRPSLSFHGSGVDGSASAQLSCYGADNPVLITIYEGGSDPTTLRGLNVVTVTGIAEGATGTFRVSEIQYVFGGGALRSQGIATLEISRHDASTDPDQRRMAGRIYGLSVLDPSFGEFVPIEAEFDVNTACAPFGR